MKLKKKRPVFRGFAILLSIMMIMTCFTGCKYSPKLHELIQDRFDHLLDTRSAKEFENDFNRVEKTDVVKAKEQDETSERKKEEKEEKPVEGESTEQQPVPESIISTGKAPEASSSGIKSQQAASSSGQSSGKSTAGSSGGTAVNGTGSGSGGVGSGSGGTGDSGTGSGGTGDSGIEIVPETGGTRQVVDSRGEYVTVPEDVNSVACSGQSAVLFYAVGGEQIIKASSESFVSNYLLDNGVRSQIQTLWRGDGTGLMSDGDFASLMELKPEVLVELSGTSAFSGDQISQLQANGTSYVVLPALDTLENIKLAVRLAGQITGDKSSSGGGNGEALASQYDSYVGQMVSNIQSNVRAAGNGFPDIGLSTDGYYNGMYSLFIQGWDDLASYSISNSNLSGMGVAYSGNNMTQSYQLMTSLMSIGGVYNTMTKVEQRSVKNLYIIPLSWWQSTMTLNVDGYLIPSEGNNGHVARVKLLEHKSELLGSRAFPAVIAGNRTVADNLMSSPVWQKGSDVETSDGVFHVNGFLSADGTTQIGSSVMGDFQAFVSPSGLGSWINGSPESILECAWIASRFYNAYSDADLVSMISEFYSQFYRITLTEAQISDILSGSGY